MSFQTALNTFREKFNGIQKRANSYKPSPGTAPFAGFYCFSLELVDRLTNVISDKSTWNVKHAFNSPLVRQTTDKITIGNKYGEISIRILEDGSLLRLELDPYDAPSSRMEISTREKTATVRGYFPAQDSLTLKTANSNVIPLAIRNYSPGFAVGGQVQDGELATFSRNPSPKQHKAAIQALRTHTSNFDDAAEKLGLLQKLGMRTFNEKAVPEKASVATVGAAGNFPG